jgi:DinB superfamily
MNNTSIEQHIDRLKETMQKVVTTANDFPAGFVHQKLAEAAFSATEIIYHLVEVEQLWQTRIDSMRPDTVVKLVALNPDLVAREKNYNVRIFSIGVDTFVSTRRHTFDVVRAFSPEQLSWKALHPKFGELTIEKILEIMEGHDLGHAAQFGRTRQALGI